MNSTTTRIPEGVPNRTRTDIRFAAETACLLEVAPAVFEAGVFALKGGTVNNLFWRDMPRLSTDPDLVFSDGTVLRDDAMRIISGELERPALIARGRGLQAQTSGSKLLLSISLKKQFTPPPAQPDTSWSDSNIQVGQTWATWQTAVRTGLFDDLQKTLALRGQLWVN